jgi:mechanosensitive ion channel-like protein
MHSLLRLVEDFGIPEAAARALLVIGLFVAAALVARASRVFARNIEAHAAKVSLDSPLIAIARRETAVSVTYSTVAILAYIVALSLSLVVVTGARGISAIAGASFLAVIIGFAAQRFLTDLIAGFLMYVEGWYSVGSTIVIEPWKLEGVVEDLSLRATTLRDVSGQVLRVSNSQVMAVRVLPDGGQRFEVELYVHDGEAGERLVEGVSKVLPSGATEVTRPLTLRGTEPLDGDLYRISADLTVAAGRAWMANELLPSLLRERAEDGLIVHGPVVLPSDEAAETQFARAERLVATRRKRTSPRRPA